MGPLVSAIVNQSQHEVIQLSEAREPAVASLNVSFLHGLNPVNPPTVWLLLSCHSYQGFPLAQCLHQIQPLQILNLAEDNYSFA